MGGLRSHRQHGVGNTERGGGGTAKALVSKETRVKKAARAVARWEGLRWRWDEEEEGRCTRHMRVSQSHPNTQPAQAGWEGGGKRAAHLQALEKTRVRVGAAGGDRWSRFVSCPFPMVSYPSPPAAPSATTDSSDRPHGGLSDHPSDRHPRWTVKIIWAHTGIKENLQDLACGRAKSAEADFRGLYTLPS